MTSFNSKELLNLNQYVHALLNCGFVEIFSTSKLSSYQVKDILDILGIGYTSTVGGVNGHKFIRIEIE